MITGKGKYILIAELLIITFLCYFPLCYRIDTQTIRLWDESRNAVNALEMMQNHNYLVRYFEGRPEVWEVKPPFLIWFQVISLKTFGVNELAIRFPIMLATFLTVFLIIYYLHRFFRNRYTGYLAALILVTTQGYINWHIARTGDHDALLILLTTAAILIFYEFITSVERKNNLLIVLSFIFILGVFTKSVAMLFIVPGLVISTFIFKAQKKLFANYRFYLAILIFLVCTGTYYVVREYVQPGYLKAVWTWELLPRYTNSDNRFESGTFWHYGINFFKSRYTWWIYILLLSVLIMPFRNKNKYNLYNYLLINSLVFFLFISTTSKNLWYDGPLFPLFAMMIALFIIHLINEFYSRFQTKPWLGNILVISLLIPLLIFPGIKIIQNVSNVDEFYWNRERFALAYYLRDPANQEKIRSEKVGVVYSEYYAHILFYVEAINAKEGNQNLSIKPLKKIEPNDLLLLSEQAMVDSINKRFSYALIEDRNPVLLIRISDRKINTLPSPDGK